MQVVDWCIYYGCALRRWWRRLPLAWMPKVNIGRHTYGTPRVLFWKEGASLCIGRYCSIADEVEIYLGGAHNARLISTYPFSRLLRTGAGDEHLLRKGGVTIADDVWIGRHAAIMPGVTIGSGAVIAAGAVVTHAVPPYAIVAGVPARLVRLRFAQDVIDQLLQIAWWNWPDVEIRSIAPLLQSEDINCLFQYAASRAGNKRGMP